MNKKALISALMAFGALAFTPLAASAAPFKVGMVTDAGTIDDKS